MVSKGMLFILFDEYIFVQGGCFLIGNIAVLKPEAQWKKLIFVRNLCDTLSSAGINDYCLILLLHRKLK